MAAAAPDRRAARLSSSPSRRCCRETAAVKRVACPSPDANADYQTLTPMSTPAELLSEYHPIAMVDTDTAAGKRINTPAQVLFASLIGTTIEFFDFYIYATAAVLVFPRLFFPASDPASATLASLATFAIAFLARPIGSALFGHFGDKVGRKTTLVAALMTMGLSTVAFGWRIPFLASAVLVLLGLYVRLTITETPVFREALTRQERVNVPMLVVFRDHAGTLVLGILVSLSAFVVFYLMTVFALSWGTSALGYSREQFLVIQLFAMLFFALLIPVSAVLAERGRRRMLIWVNVAIVAFGLVMAPLFEAGTAGAVTM